MPFVGIIYPVAATRAVLMSSMFVSLVCPVCVCVLYPVAAIHVALKSAFGQAMLAWLAYVLIGYQFVCILYPVAAIHVALKSILLKPCWLGWCA